MTVEINILLNPNFLQNANNRAKQNVKNINGESNLMLLAKTSNTEAIKYK